MIRKIVKRILKSTIVSYITFFMVNFVVIFLISLLLWASFNCDDVFYAGIGRIVNVDKTIPSWSWEYPSPYIPFETVFIMVAIMYSVMIFIIFIGALFVARFNLREYRK